MSMHRLLAIRFVFAGVAPLTRIAGSFGRATAEEARQAKPNE